MRVIKGVRTIVEEIFSAHSDMENANLIGEVLMEGQLFEAVAGAQVVSEIA